MSFTEVLDIIDAACAEEKVTIGGLLDVFGRRAFGPFLLVPALISILPVVGALPGVSIGTALLEIAVAAQLILGERRLRLPAWARRISVPRKPLKLAIKMVRPTARWTGHVVRPRLQAVTNDGTRHMTGVLALFIALLMLLGALVPGGIVLPALAMIVLSLGLTSHDGVLVLTAATLSVCSVGLAFWLWP